MNCDNAASYTYSQYRWEHFDYEEKAWDWRKMGTKRIQALSASATGDGKEDGRKTKSEFQH
jgi:hypothetical protein